MDKYLEEFPYQQKAIKSSLALLQQAGLHSSIFSILGDLLLSKTSYLKRTGRQMFKVKILSQ